MLAACTLSIEAGELVFSLAARYCRVVGIPLEALSQSSLFFDRAGLRDFPIVAASLEKQMGTPFRDRSQLFSDHSAAVYFGTTIAQPFRSQEIKASFAKAGNLLRISAGNSWSHLRFCEECAMTEFRLYRYSWWHRDHQLPLTNVCLVHERLLVDATVQELNQSLPHELLDIQRKASQGDVTDLSLRLTRYEQFFASAERYPQLLRLFERAKMQLAIEAHDIFDQQEIACACVKLAIQELERCGVTAPASDWERIGLGVRKLIRDGLAYSDPVIAILFVEAMNGPTHDLLDF